MPMTLTQKILAAHCGREEVKKGDLIFADVDLTMGNDITASAAIAEFNRAAEKTTNPDRIVMVMDHFVPNKDIKAAEQCKTCRSFCRAQGIDKFYDVGEMGIEHTLLPDKGLVTAGDLVIGADSHTCTYGALGAFSTGVGSTDMAYAMASGKVWFKVPAAIRFVLRGKFQKNVSGKDLILHIIGKIGVDGALYRSMEFTGDGVTALEMCDRFTVCNMAIEAGAKNGVFPVDEKTVAYLKEHGAAEPKIFEADADAEYEATYEIDLSELEPTVAFPYLPENARTVSEIDEDIFIDQVVIGSCTNGRIEDLRRAAAVMGRHRVADGVRAIIIPATQQIYLQAIKEGLIQQFVNAGCVVSTPTCGPCLGGYMGILAAGEKAVSTTNRNFVGRMGHRESQVYLASPATAAACAVAGKLISPNALEV